MIGVAVLGSTGSIGVSTLDVLARHTERYRVVALAAHSNTELLAEQCLQFQPDFVALADATKHADLLQRLGKQGQRCEVLVGAEAAEQLAVLPQVDYVMAAIVGAAGLPSTLAAAAAGKRVLIANKEALVMAGPLVMAAAARSGATLIPIDSEHNAIFQCLPTGTALGVAPPGVQRIMLTASGGPFRDWSAERLHNATPVEACAHPTWSMGRKISVDSATLMNKGLELIEAGLLFGLPVAKIQVVIHRQSIVHSLVEYVDGSVLAQLGSPDMRTPIAHALAWPQRMGSGVQFLDLLLAAKLEFEAPDLQRFPSLQLAMDAAQAGGAAPAALSAANEVAVAAFLEGRLNFGGIPEVIGEVMNSWKSMGNTLDLPTVLAADSEARRLAATLLSRTDKGWSARI